MTPLKRVNKAFKKISRKWKIAGGILAFFFLLILLSPLPRPLFSTPRSTILKSVDHVLLSAAIAPDGQWRFPPLDTLSEKYTKALLLFEDEYFWYHPGINPVSLFRAVRQNLDAGKIVSGGSTLSMQTVRISFGNQDRTYLQKLLELFSTLKLELLHSKEEILLHYANNAPFGGNIVGISAASYRYFGRPSSELSWAEACMLAILPNNPGSIFPGKNAEALLKKRNQLLEKLHSSGLISADELFMAQKESLPKSIRPLPAHAYHLLYRSIEEGHGGKEVNTTLDARLQIRATQKVTEYSQIMAGNQIHNAAAIIVEIESGNTLAYVGNSQNPGSHGQHVDIANSLRSPGSLLKPFLYTSALDEGLIAPSQLLPDIPLFYNGFAPRNFDKKFHGAVKADEALAASLNVPFVFLLKEYGYERFYEKLKQIGFENLTKPAGHYGLSIVLGGGETTLWEVSGAYASLVRANHRVQNRPLNSGYSDEDYHPLNYLDGLDQSKTTLKPDGYFREGSIRFMLEALKQVQRPDEETGWEWFGSSSEISWKTGTSFGLRDAWAIGMNDTYLVGVWLGNADGEGRPGLTGVRTAAPLMFDLFELVGGEEDVLEPGGMEKQVCTKSGMIASRNCEETVTQRLPAYLSEKTCGYHQLVHLDQTEKFMVNSSCYEVSKLVTKNWFVLPPVQAWYFRIFHPDYQSLPRWLSGCEHSSTKKPLALIYPGHYSKVHIPLEQDGKRGRAIFEAAHENARSVVYWHLDADFLGSTQGAHQMDIWAEKGSHTITLVDDQGNEIVQAFEVIN